MDDLQFARVVDPAGMAERLLGEIEALRNERETATTLAQEAEVTRLLDETYAAWGLARAHTLRP